VIAWTEDAVKRLKAVGAKVIVGPVAVAIALHPKSTKNGQPYARRIDLDNAIKGALDACQGLVFVNDNQVTRIHAVVSFPMTNGGLSLMAWHAADPAPDFETYVEQ
jgi:Holliday junction resolvase RusA-like endonuclease